MRRELIKILKNIQSDPSNPYLTLDAAATGELQEVLGKIEEQVMASMSNRYTQQYREKVRDFFEEAILNVPKIRKCAMNLLFAHDGDFDTDYNVRSLATFAGNAGIIPPAHYNETFVAWAKAGVNWRDHSPSEQSDATNDIPQTVKVKKVPKTSIR